MSHVIAAVSTGHQVTAIGIIRLSGEGCAEIGQKVFSRKNGALLSQAPNRKLVLGTLHDKQGRAIDDCLAVYTRGPNSYTGEDTVEFHCHGSLAVLSAGLEALYLAGAKPAQRGEFTKRAFLNGRMDLTQAEAVIDLIEADTADAAANAAGQVTGALKTKLSPVYRNLTDLCGHFHAVLDYPDDDIDDFSLASYYSDLDNDAKALFSLLQTYGQGRLLRQGITTAIVGKPNVGKSSLLNAMAGFERAIVTDIPGTTRDTVEQTVMLGANRLRLIDTAGIRSSEDPIEAIGIARAMDAIRIADLTLFVCDGSQPLTDEDRRVMNACMDTKNVIALINKTDLTQIVQPGELPFSQVIPICAQTGDGLSQLSEAISAMFEQSVPCDGSILTNTRQNDAIRRSYEAILRAIEGLKIGQTPDAVLLDVESAMEAIGEVTGATVREDITARIFERFCVGK